MSSVRNILRLFVVMLFSALGASMAVAAPMDTTEIPFYQTENTPFSQAADVGFTARAPPLAVAKFEVPGGVTPMQGSAFALHGQETVAALFGFVGDHKATNSRPAHLTSHPDAHTVGRHGPQVTDQQLETRALTGVAPGGSTLSGGAIPRLSSTFHSEGAMLRADTVMRGQPLQDAIAANPTATRLTIPPFDAGENIGRGYRRIGSSNPNNVGRNGPPERVDGLSHATATVELNPITGAWETITMFPALP